MEIKKQITVFGATGKIGTELIRLLSDAGITTVAVTRQPNKALVLPYITWIKGDMADKQTLGDGIKGSSGVFLLSGNSPDFVLEQSNVIDVAQQLGVNHIVKLSSGAADPKSPYYIPRTHGEVEARLISSGITWTMLRPIGIMQNWLGEIAESVRKERRFFEATGTGKRAHVDRRDIADAAFNCLIDPEKHKNKTYLLTGSRAVSYDDIADAISKATAEKVAYVPISLDEARGHMRAAGLPHALTETFIAYDEAQRNGQTEVVTDAVLSITGKPPRTLEGFFNDYRESFI